MTPIAEIKRQIAFALLAGYLLLDYPFMQLRLPPSGFGIPLGELYLVFALMTTDVPLSLSRMSSVVYFLPFLVWWTYGIGRALADSVSGGGIWALRDATQVIESLYMIVGFSIAGNSNSIERLSRRLPILLMIACVYGLGYPFRHEIRAMSPNVTSADGNPVPLFGSYGITGTMMLWTAFYCLIAPSGNRLLHRWQAPIAGGLIAFVIVLIQERTSYLQFIGLAALLLLFRGRALGKLARATAIPFLAVGVIAFLGQHVAGRLTDKISFDFFLQQAGTIFGIGAHDHSAVGSAALGVDMRIDWWENIYDKLTADAGTLLTGLGYGIPLTNFRDQFGDLVREPHNSYISVVARLGLLGLIAWAWMLFELFRSWLRAYRASRALPGQEGNTLLLMIMAFAVLMMIGAVGEDAFEKPYQAIPFYLLWGVTLRMAYAFDRRTHASAAVRSASPLARSGRPFLR